MPSPAAPLVIVVDDAPEILQFMEHQLKSWNLRMVGFSNQAALMAHLEREIPVALMLDLHLGKTDGMEVLKDVLKILPDLPVVMLTGQGSIQEAVRAIKLGAYDFLTKPADLDRMRLILEHATERQKLNARVKRLEQIVDEPGNTVRLLGDSLPMRHVKSMVTTVASTDATVLVLGETGTGKELIARCVHELSARRTGPLVPVNMAALPRELAEATLFGHEKGAFTGASQTRIGCCEAAAGGTLFLDEIGEMDLSLQAKILRFLQERKIYRVGSNEAIPVDVRVVAATNRDLVQLVRQGQFREDLYYRLNVIPINLPALRDRREDIPLLAARFLHRFSFKYEKPLRQFTSEAIDVLIRFDWPGNIRQMENLVERMVILSTSPSIGVEQLPADILPRNSFGTDSALSGIAAAPKFLSHNSSANMGRMDEIEKKAICDALHQTQGKVREAARILGLSAATLYRKFKHYNISVDSVLANPSVTVAS